MGGTRVQNKEGGDCENSCENSSSDLPEAEQVQQHEMAAELKYDPGTAVMESELKGGDQHIKFWTNSHV